MGPKTKVLNRRQIVGVLAGALLTAGLWPTSYLASPRWEVWVVTSDGKPLPGINVRLDYQNFSAEGQSHEATLQTDENGRALFPPQYQRASFFERVFYTVSSARAGVHASFGRHAWVFAFGADYDGDALSGKYITDWRGYPDSMESRIVARKRGS